MRTLIVAAVLAFSANCASLESTRRDACPLVKEGIPAATIVLGTKPTRAAQFAAFELQWHLRRISGATIPIVHEGDPVHGTPVFVGDSAAARALGVHPEDFKAQAYAARRIGDALVLAGHDKDDRGAVRYDDHPDKEEIASWPSIWDEQGSVHAVYDFLGNTCGVRWLDPTDLGLDCPVRKTVSVGALDIRRAPFMRYRFADYRGSLAYDDYTGLWPMATPEGRAWEARAYADLHAKFGGQDFEAAKEAQVTLFRLRHKEGGEPCYGNHAFYGYYRRFWAPEKGKEGLFEGRHADWFAKGYEGRPPQMCYTDRGFIEQAAKDACEFFETGKVHPGAQAVGDFFCLEPMDDRKFCKCPECQKGFGGQDAGSPFFTNGQHSDYFFGFVNEVAKIVGKKHPAKTIVCLAYMTHGAPPEHVRLEPNVRVQFCFAGNRLVYDHATYDHEVELLRRWRKEYPGRELYLWNYDCFPVERGRLIGHFNCFPGFFAHAIGRQFALFQECGCRGVFHCGYGQEVDAYVTYRLMDDPTLSVDALLDDWFLRAYGRAAAPMKKFYERVEQIYADPTNYGEAVASGVARPHTHQTEAIAWGRLGTAERMKELARLVDEADALAQTPEEKRRMELFHLGTWSYMQAGRAKWEKK